MDRPYNGTTTIYTQHELTAAEIARDKGKAAAIARNRAAGVVKRRKHDINNVTIVHVNDAVSDPQKGLIESLLKDLSVVDEPTWRQASAWWFGPVVDGEYTGVVCTANKSLASQTIARLKTRITEAKTRTTPPTARQESASARTGATLASMAPATRTTNRDRFTDVPDGYYAVFTEEEVLAFYRVSTWKSGDRKVQVHASDTLHLIRGHRSTDAILAKIRELTPLTSGKLFAKEIGSCYRCGRTLTDDESRARGIGPVCAGK